MSYLVPLTKCIADNLLTNGSLVECMYLSIDIQKFCKLGASINLGGINPRFSIFIFVNPADLNMLLKLLSVHLTNPFSIFHFFNPFMGIDIYQ